MQMGIILTRIGKKARTFLSVLRPKLLRKRFLTLVWKWQLALGRTRFVTKRAYRRGSPKPGVDGWTVLQQLTQTKTALGLDGNAHKSTPFISAEEGQELHDVLREVNPEWALEIGFLHGYSTLNMLQALSETGHGKLVSIDPGQFSGYAQGIGLMNVRRARLERFHVFWPESSQFALPRLCRLDMRIQFAFMDGNHLLDYTMLEFFYLDKLLSPGGILVFHDYLNPSVHAVTKFVEANHSYTVKPCAAENLRMLVKQGEDSRPWYYFVPFLVPDVAWRTSENRPMVAPE
jgi:predicted O-methyltransferase YrrM